MSFLISLHHQTAGGEAHWLESEDTGLAGSLTGICTPASSLTHLLHPLPCNMRKWDKGISKVSSSPNNSVLVNFFCPWQRLYHSRKTLSNRISHPVSKHELAHLCVLTSRGRHKEALRCDITMWSLNRT